MSSSDKGFLYAQLPTNIVDFTGFDSSIILIQRGGILMSIGNLPESLSQAMLVGTMLVGGLGVLLLYIYIYIYIYRERERCICVYIYIYIYNNS